MIEQPPSETGIQEGRTLIDAPVTREPTSDPVIPLPPLPPAEPMVSSLPTRWTFFDIILLLMLTILSFFLGSFAVNNNDFWQHLATGRLIAQGDYELGVDPFSFASHHEGTPIPWVNHAWLYDLLLYLLYSAAGGPGVVIVQALLMVGLFALLLGIRSRDDSRLATLLIAGLTMLVVSQRLPVSPLMASYLLFALLLLLLRRGGAWGTLGEDDEASPRALWCVPLVFIAWVNLDAWFMLGLLTLLLVVVGNALGGALGWNRRDHVKTQALVLLLSVAACLLNPHHVRAFTLPPELAYLTGSIFPTSLSGSGAALRGLLLHDFEPLAGAGWSSPISATYLGISANSIVALAFYVLLLVSFVSFVLVMLVIGPRASTAGLPLARLLTWMVLTLLAVLMVRMIPFFAIGAGAAAILNFADCARTWRRQPGAAEARGFNPNLARFASFTLVFIALVLAWPGWLHARIGVNSGRRVAWDIQEDPSLRAAAEALARAQAKNVFNFSFDIAHYCAWFAPGVRCYIDHRLALFPFETARYAKAKSDLRLDAREVIERGRPGLDVWREVFRVHQIDHIAVNKVLEPQQTNLVSMFWLRPWHWTQEYADGRNGVFGWSRTARTPAFDLLEVWNREAFGPGDKEPVPTQAVDPPQGGPTLQSLYLKGQPVVTPRSTTEPFVHLVYFNMVKRRWAVAYEPVWRIAAWTAPAGLGSTVPGTVLGPNAMLAYLSNVPMLTQARDVGPPAVPLLMIRQARRAIHENVFEPRGYLALYEALKLQALLLEEPWVSPPGTTAPTNDRANIRQVQMLVSLRNALDLLPDDWNLRRELATMLYRQHYLDAGLEQLAWAQRSLDKERSAVRDKRTQDALRAQAKELSDAFKEGEREVKGRKSDFDLRSAKLEPFDKFQLAVLAPYKTIDDRNKGSVDPRGRGLVLEGLKHLQSISADSLKDEQKTAVHFWRFRLLAMQGRIAEATSELTHLAQGPQLHEPLLWHAAALGDYELMERALASMETQAREMASSDTHRGKLSKSLSAALIPHVAERIPVLVRIHQVFLSTGMLLRATDEYHEVAASIANWRTLRGLVALETGAVARAEEHFAEALRMAGTTVQFSDRAIARRYLELIRAQKK